MKAEDIYTLTPEITDLTAQLKALGEEQEVLAARSRKLQKAREKLINEKAKEAATPAEIAAFRHSSVAAARRMQAEVKKLHPAFYNAVSWSITDVNGRIDYSQPLLGVHLTVDYNPSAEYIDSFVEALHKFVEIFEIQLPKKAEGFHYGQVLARDCGEVHSWQFYYDPVTDRARLEDVRWSSGDKYAGTIREMVVKLCEVGWYHTGSDNLEDW